MNWFRSLFMWPGRDVLLVNRRAVILERLPNWQVRVRTMAGEMEVWWRGNLYLIL